MFFPRREESTATHGTHEPTPETRLRLDHFDDRRQHKHLNFNDRSRFELKGIEELFQYNLDLSRLESLDLSNNALTSIQPIKDSDAVVRSLRNLKARGNRIVKVELALPSLKELDLSFNRLMAIPPMVGMPEVEVLLLSDNEMIGSWKTLSNTRSLKKLDIANNRFNQKPSELEQELDVLHELFTLRSLRLKGNPFTKIFPEYQSFVLHRLKHLEFFDELKKKELLDAKDVAKDIALDIASFERTVYDREQAFSKAKPKEGEKQASLVPTWSELCAPIQAALEDESQIGKAIQQFVRVTSKINEAAQQATDPSDKKMDILFRDIRGSKNEKVSDLILSAKQGFLGNFQILLSRIDNQEQYRVMLLRSLAKLSVVVTQGVGEDCMRLLALLLKKGKDTEREVLAAVREIVVEPLAGRTMMDAQTMPLVTGLANFNSKDMPATLAPIAGWLAKMYCNNGASPQRAITQLLATVTLDERNCEAAINYDGTIGGPGMGAGATQKELLPQHVMIALENKQLSQNESLREQYMGHLKIVQNTCKGLGARIAETYEEKSLHRDLIKACKLFFGDGVHVGDDTPNQNRVPDITKMKTLDLRTCAALLDCLHSMMSSSQDIMMELMDSKLPHGVTILDYLLHAPRAPVADPVLLASSLRGVSLILEKYSHENASERHEVMKKIIKALGSMKPMLEYIDASNRKYRSLWMLADKHEAERHGDGSVRTRSEALQAPRFTALTSELMHEAFCAIVKLVEYFTAEAHTDVACQEVSSAMNSAGREKLLFKLLRVPSDPLKEAVMSCVNNMNMMELTTEEVGYLITLLKSTKDVTSEESLLEKIIQQLRKLASGDKGGRVAASQMLRSDHAKTAIDAVSTVLLKNQSRDTYGEVNEEAQKNSLARACVQFLEVASKANEFRAHMRSKYMVDIFTQVLRCEDELSNPAGVDVPVERTWTGRSVETLMQVISGKDRLKPQGRVAFRVIQRMADVLEGQTDEELGDFAEDRISPDLAKKEAKMWDAQKMKMKLNQLSNVEQEDREKQQQIFATFGGVQRILAFLMQLEPPEQQSLRRMEEVSQIDDSEEFLQTAKAESKIRMDHAVAAIIDAEDKLKLNGKSHAHHNGSHGAEGDADGNEDNASDDGEADRGQLMKVLLEVDEQPFEKQPLQGGLGSSSLLNREMMIREQEHFWEDESAGRMNKAFVIAALLRCCHAMLRLRCAESLKAETVKALRNPMQLASLVSLVRLCGPFDCSLAAKFLRIMSLSLQLSPSQSVEKPETIIVYDIVSKYCQWVCGVTTTAMQQSDEYVLVTRARTLGGELTKLMSIMSRATTFCIISPDGIPDKYQAPFVEYCLERIVPLPVIKSIVQMIQHDPSKSLAEAAEAVIDEKGLKDMKDQAQVMHHGRQVISLMLDKCPKLKHNILEIFSTSMVTGTTPIRNTFVSGILAQMSQSKEKAMMQGAMDVAAQPGGGSTTDIVVAASGGRAHAERTLLAVRVEYYWENQFQRIYDPTKRGAGMACIVTDQHVRLVDTSLPGYPQNPKFVAAFRLMDMTRIVSNMSSKGVPQVLHVGWIDKNRNNKESFMRLICHRESDRRELVGTLHALSVPEGGDIKDRVPLQQDTKFTNDVYTHVTENLIASQFVERIVGEEVRSALFLLADTQILEFSFNFESWSPPAEREDGDAGPANESSDEEAGPAGAVSGRLQTDNDDGSKARQLRIGQATRFQRYFDPEGGAAALEMEIEEITKRRRAARQANDGDNEDSTRPFAGGRGEAASMKQTWQVDALQKMIFFQEGRPRLQMELEAPDGQGKPDVVLLQFYDDMGRETWRQKLMGQLTSTQSSWTRQYNKSQTAGAK